MIRYLIKNNFKLMLRNTWSILVMILGPVLVVAVLSSAFAELMKSYEGVDEFSVGYRMTETADFEAFAGAAKESGANAGILFAEYPEGEIREVMEKNNLAGFVEFSGDTYVVYTSSEHEAEGISLEYFMNRVMKEGLNAAVQLPEQADVVLSVETLDYMPSVSAKDYYGITEIVYFCWCTLICATGVLSSEKKYGISRRFQVANVSGLKNYLAKFISITLTAGVGMLFATAMTVLLFDIHWGNPVLSMAIVLGMIMAGTAFGMMFYNISNNLVITIILLFTVVWFMGFFGGSFETYMFSSMPDALKQLSPIYHGNRALVELSCMGESSYTGSAIGYSVVFTGVCSAIAILSGSIRKRGRA